MEAHKFLRIKMAGSVVAAPVTRVMAGLVANPSALAPTSGALASLSANPGTAQDETLLKLFPTDLAREVPILRHDNPDLQIIVSGEKKFMINKSYPGFKPKPGDPYPAQKLAAVLMDVTDALLLYWIPGTGKTGAMTEIAEHYRRRYQVGYIDGQLPTPIRRCFVIVINPTVRRELKSLIFCKHTNGYYFSERINNAPTKRQQKKEITRSLGQWYEFHTYIGLIGYLVEAQAIDKEGNILDQQKFIDKCDHILYLCDEIHTLQQDKETGGTGKRKDIVFKILMNIRILCKNSRMVLATGTPINKDVSEGLSILKLLNGQEIENSFTYKGRQVTIEELTSTVPFEDFLDVMRPYMAGRVSYMESPGADAEPLANGEPLVINGQPTGLNMYYSIMSDRQTYWYLRQTHIESPNLFPGIPPERNAFQKRDTSAAHKYQIEASIFTYPDFDPEVPPNGVSTEVVGIRAYEYYIEDEKAPRKIKEPKDGRPNVPMTAAMATLAAEQTAQKPNYKNIWHSPKLIRIFTNGGQLNPSTREGKLAIINNIGQYSAVFHAILMATEGFLPNVPVVVTPGCMYVFFVSVENGIAPFCMALEALGYERYLDTSSKENKQVKPQPPCRGERMDELPKIGKALRYGVITSKTDDVANDSLRELQMSPHNADGSYIRFMVVSGMAKAGINVFHAQQHHLGEGHWAPGTDGQASKRPRRLVGFDALKAIWPKGVPFQTYVFRHVAIPAGVVDLEQDRATLMQSYNSTGGANSLQAQVYARRIQLIDASIRYHKAYIGEQDPSMPGVPPIGKLVYTRMYGRSLNNNVFYQGMKVHAIDAWPNRELIVSKFSDTDPEHKPFEPYRGPPATVIRDGDYYLTHGDDEINGLAKQLAAEISSSAEDIFGLLSGGGGKPIELVGEAVRRVLETDPPLDRYPGDPDAYPITVDHWNRLHMPFALNYRNGLLYQQAELGPPDQMLQFYRDYLIMSNVSDLSHVNAMLGEDPADIVADLRKLPVGPEVRNRLSFSATRGDRFPIPQETHVAVVELIISEAWKTGWEALPGSFKQILHAYRNVIFVFPRNEQLTEEVASQVDTSTVKVAVNESIAFNRMKKWMEQPEIYGNFIQYRPMIFSLDVYLNTPQLRQSPVRKVIIHMLNYVTQDPSQEFGSGSVYRTPFDGRRPKFPIRIYEEPAMASPTVARWRGFGQADSIIYQILIRNTIDEIILPYTKKVGWRSESEGFRVGPPGGLMPGEIQGGEEIEEREGVYVIAFTNGVKRILSPATPTGRDLGCMAVDVAKKILNMMKPAIKEVTDIRRSDIGAQEMRRAIWNNLVHFGAVFTIVDWGIPEAVDFNCRRGGA